MTAALDKATEKPASPPPSWLDVAGDQIRRAYPRLLHHYSAEFGEREIGAIFVHYAFGVIEGGGSTSWPHDQAEFLRTVAASVLGDVPASRALMERPQSFPENVAKMIHAAEGAGRREGVALRKSADNYAEASKLRIVSNKD